VVERYGLTLGLSVAQGRLKLVAAQATRTLPEDQGAAAGE